MADLPIQGTPPVAARLAAALDREGKILRTLDALGPLADRDVVLLDAAGGLRARQLAELGARLTLLERDAAQVDTLLRATADLAGARVAQGRSAATGLPDASADCIVTWWSAFRDDLAAELAEAERILRPGGRLLVLHDYGRDDVSRLRGAELPEYGSWSRRDGWFLRTGFKVRVVHCWWTFDTLEDTRDFLAAAFGSVGGEVAATMKRPRLSYNVAVYHRTRGGASASEGT